MMLHTIRLCSPSTRSFVGCAAITIPAEHDVPAEDPESVLDAPQDLDKKWQEMALPEFG